MYLTPSYLRLIITINREFHETGNYIKIPLLKMVNKFFFCGDIKEWDYLYCFTFF